MKNRLLALLTVVALVLSVQGAAQYGAWLGRLTYSDAFAQIPPPAIQAVDIRTHSLVYNWTVGPDIPSELRIKCRPEGTPLGQYTFTRVVPVLPSGAITLVELLPKSNLLYYCVLLGAVAIPGPNGSVLYAEGVASSEFPFAAAGTQFGSGSISIASK